MPRVREVKSLKGLCLDYVVKAVDDWINKLVVEVTDSGSSMIELLEKGKDDKLNKSVKTLLDALPSTVLLEIANLYPYKGYEFYVSKGNQLIKCYLNMLFSGIIDLCFQPAEKIYIFFQIAIKRCPSMKQLSISHRPQDIQSDNLESYIHRFTRLQILAISNSNFGDSCMKLIGTFCKDLRKLNVSRCPKVTDVGVAALCVSVDHLGNKNEAFGQCKSIVKLWTKNTQVTIRGIQVVLLNLPYLQYWDMASFQTLIEMEKDFQSKKEVEILKCSLNFLELKIWDQKKNSPYISGSLKMVLPFCPSLLEVHITTIDGLKDADLLCLIHVEKLCKLRIQGRALFLNSEITFDGGVVPLLKAKGHSLNALQLRSLKTPINIGTVTELCPNLYFLVLESNHKYITSTWNSSQPKRFKFEIPKLKNLVKLSLFNEMVSNSSVPSEDLAFLLSSPCLVEITMTRCNTLTDDVLLTAVKSNPFLRLKELKLSCCNSITDKGVDVFMQENPIKKILLWFCEQITDDDIVEWKSKVVQMNWDLDLQYKSWPTL